ncbi:MAG: hypothetical protein HS117_07050 [Verrucomicrobiaceae bacterium]|nr:hypothetical protein [Verrucomicrobiaceae bacterium]
MKHSFLSLLLSCVWLQAAESVITLREKPVRVATSGSAEIFPESWRDGKVAASAESLPDDRREAALWLLAKEHPPIQRKLALVPRFYQQLHPALDEAFFRKLPPTP